MTPETALLSSIMAETLRAETPDPDASQAPDPAQAALDRDAGGYLSLALDATLAQGAPAPLALDTGTLPGDPTPAPAGEQAPVDLLMGASVPAQAPQGPDPASLQAKLAEITARLQAKQGTTAPVSRAERMHAVGAQAEFTRLPAYKGRPATWALLVHPIDGMTPERGQVVTVAKRNGTLEAHEIGAVLFQKGRGWVCALVSPQAKAQTVPLCPGNNNCRRYGHRKSRNCR